MKICAFIYFLLIAIVFKSGSFNNLLEFPFFWESQNPRHLSLSNFFPLEKSSRVRFRNPHLTDISRSSCNQALVE